MTSVKSEKSEIPEYIKLFQNSPNPFNPQTTITYILAKPTEVNIEIFNVIGQRIRTLESGYKESGLHSIIWDGCDDKGLRAGAGVYIYRLRTGREFKAKKMVLADGGGGAYSSNVNNLGVAKPTIDLTHFILIVQKDGYKDYRIENLRLPVNGDPLEIGIQLEQDRKSGDFFPLEIGNTWSFINAENIGIRDRNISSDVLYDEWSISVVDTVRIDGNLYYILDGFSPFIPKPPNFKVDKPIVRIREDGDILLFADNREYLLYDFNGPQFENDIESLPYGPTAEIIDWECAIKTPAGSYTNCRRMYIFSETSNGDYSICEVWFSRKNGPVYYRHEYPESETLSFLKKANVNSNHFGVIDGVLADEKISDSDISEIYRLLMDPWWFENTTTFPDNFLYENNLSGDFVFSSENFRMELMPDNLPFPFKILSSDEIQKNADKYWEYWYYIINDLTVGENSIVVTIDFRFRLAQDNPGGLLAGGGFIVEFTPVLGMWISTTRMTWISKPYLSE